MANPVCTKASLVTNYPQFSGKNLNDKQRLALTVWYLANELSVIGGTNYTAALLGTGAGTLLTAETDLYKTMDDDQLKTARLAIVFNNAVAAGASVSSAQATFSQNIKCLINVPTPDLERFVLVLLCKLGFHKTYPR